MPALRLRILAASFGIYIFWGSAYLAMAVGLRTLPPLVLAGLRLLLAGLLMGGFAMLRGHRPNARHWKAALGAAVLLFLGGHGCLYWGQDRVSSGLAAVLFATFPLWIVLIEGLAPHDANRANAIHLGARALSGLAMGLAGVVVLVGPARLLGAGQTSLSGAIAITLAALFWALGSIYCTRAALPGSGALAGGMEMFLGGLLLVAAAWPLGEWRGFHFAQVSAASWGAVAFLVLCSSMIGFSCFLWLLKVASAARVSTYAYVNPLVAVALGWTVAGEAITPRILGAIGLLLAAVVLIVNTPSRQPQQIVAAAGAEP